MCPTLRTPYDRSNGVVPGPRTTPETHVRCQERVQEEPQDPYYLYAKYMSLSDPPDWALLAERYIDRAVAEQYGLRGRRDG